MEMKCKKNYRLWSWFISFAILLTVMAKVPSQAYATDSSKALTDFHIHVQSPVISDCINQYWEDTNHPMSAFAQHDAITADTIIEELDKANFKNAFIISRAYAWTLSVPFLPYPMLEDSNVKSILEKGALKGYTEKQLVQYENDWTMDEANKYPQRLTAIFSINPMREYAKEEIDRCVKKGFKAMKLHLGSSNVNIHDAAQLTILTDILKYAQDKKLVVLIHCGTIYTTKGDGQIFAKMLSEVQGTNKKSKIILAHMGGMGDPTNTTMKEMIDWTKANPGKLDKKNIYFDISASLWTKETSEMIQAKGVPFVETSPDIAKQVAENLKEWGLSNILFGSDYYVLSSDVYLNAAQSVLGEYLTEKELNQLLNKNPSTIISN